jgi:luciferase-type oxidoreductase
MTYVKGCNGNMNEFNRHQGYRRMFKENHLTLGLFFPLEAYEGSIPEMNIEEQVKLAKRADQLNFASLFVRDIPLFDQTFGDAGQIYDPWVYLGFIAAHTERIALGTGSIILTLRHPLHVAKAAASIDKLSGGRLVFGVATGDRQIEFPTFSVDFEKRAELYREAIKVMRTVWKHHFPKIHTTRVHMVQGDVLPKPELGDIPVLVTGHSGQSLKWIAEHADGWLTYPRNLSLQTVQIQKWRSLNENFKPFSQSLYVDLTENPDEPPTGIRLGFRTGRKFLIQYLEDLKNAGVNHVIINLKFAQRPVLEVIEELGEEVLPYFPTISD